MIEPSTPNLITETEIAPEGSASPVKIPHVSRVEAWIRHSYSAIVFSILALFITGAFLGLRPLIDGVKTANAEVDRVVQETDQELVYLESLQRSVAAAKQIPPEILNQVSEALPTEVHVPSLLVQFEAAAAKNGIRITSLSISDPKTAADVSKATRVNRASNTIPVMAPGSATPFDISLGVTARNYLEVKRFLADIEQNLRVMDIASFSTGGFQADGSASFTLQLKAYIFPRAETTK